MNAPTRTDNLTRPLWLLAGILAWLIPGAGHLLLGRRLRGLVIFVTLSATFWAGMAIGGVMTVDRPYQKWWFAAQMLNGVHGLTGWVMQDRVYKSLDLAAWDVDDRGPAGRPGAEQMAVDAALAEKGIVLAGPSAAVARAYTGIAGLLNLLCVFDAIMLGLLGVRGEPDRARPAGKDESA